MKINKNSTIPPKIIFLFPGYGEHYQGMANELYKNVKIFRDHLNYCIETIEDITSINIFDILYGSFDDHIVKAQFEKQLISGISLFSVEYSLAQTYMNLGVHPSAMVGYSMGEYISSCIAGVMSLKDSLKFILEQGKYIDTLPPGCMMAVPLPIHEIEKYLIKDQVNLAAINGPKVCILSGNTEAIKKTKSLIRKEKRVESLILNSSQGFHSYLMEPIMDDIIRIGSKIQVNTPKIDYISSVSGDWISINDLKSSDYWARKLREPVNFEKGIQKVLDDPSKILLEVGPRQSLFLLIKNHPNKHRNQLVLSSMPHLPNTESELEYFFKSLEVLKERGINIDFQKL